MTKKKSIKELIAASSLGTPGAVAVRKMRNWSEIKDAIPPKRRAKIATRVDAALDEFEQAALDGVRQELRDRIARALDRRAGVLADSFSEMARELRTVAADIRSGILG